MAEAVIGAVVSTSIEIVLQNLKEQISLVRHFKKDLASLKKSLDMVHDFLYDAEMKQVTNRAVKRWLRNLEDVVFEADNVLGEINYQILSNKNNVDEITHGQNSKTMKKKLQSFCSCSKNPIENRRRLALRIKEIKVNLADINRQARDFRLQTHAPVSGSDAFLETDSFSVEPNILGRENDVSRIVNQMLTMTSTTPSERQVHSVLPIVGMGGLGKTTLARKVFHAQQIISLFGDNRVWVHVGRKLDVVVLLKNILSSFPQHQNVELGTREALLKELQKHLGTTRYLLVLDDVWNEDREMWDSFFNSLSGITSAMGNCIIVTTRSQEVAEIVRTLPVHKLESISEADCWSIIKAKAFNNSKYITTEFEEMGRNIAQRCKGLPLAAKVVGGVLRRKSKDEWLSIEKKWLSDFEDGNTISKILKLSFDNLSSPSLKKCFAYCSIFPKGYEIGKEQLIELWMAEGFLQRSDDMETMGNRFCNLLLQNSLLQVVKRDNYDNVTHCSMHDLVHDLACSILCVNDNVMDEICRSRYSGYRSSGNIESCYIPKEQEKCVRTLFCNVKISEITFLDFKSLHTLTLVSEGIDGLPTSIRELIHLRYLDTSDTRIKYLPDSVGELYHLQTIRAKRERRWPESYLEKLPDSLKYLINLRHLHITNNTKLPPEIGRLTSLQTLPYFCVRDKKGHGIVELGNLKNLKGELEIHNLQKVRDTNEAMSADLLGKTNINKLKLVWDAKREGEENDENVLEGLRPNPNLKSLEICGFKGKSLPLWTLKMAVHDGRSERLLNNLTEIKLRNCSECEELPMLGHLPHLKSLYLCDLKNVRSIGSSFYNIDKCSSSRDNTIVVFGALERLELSNMPNLREWVEVELSPSEVAVFERLEYLEVEGCWELKSAPSHFPYLKELKIGDIESASPLESILMKSTTLTKLNISRIQGAECLPNGLFSNNFLEQLKSAPRHFPYLKELKIGDIENASPLESILMKSTTLTKLIIYRIQGVECLPNGLFSNNHNLLELEIYDCLNLRELPDDLHRLNSLETLRIERCPNLKSIPYQISSGHDHESLQAGFTSLRNLIISDCKGLTNLPIEMVESCAQSLEGLTLIGLSSSIRNLGMVIEGCLHKMPRLTKLEIKEVPKFNINLEIGSLRLNIRYLTIGPSDDSSWNNVSFNETVDVILQPSQFSLRNLTLSGMEHWDCLPDQLQHLNALSFLDLCDFGIEALPEWFGNLLSLKDLRLFDCKKLMNLPSKEAMQRLTKLIHIEIWYCPLLLKKRCNNNIHESPQIDDSEWPKISHIPIIYVDCNRISSGHGGN